MLLRLIKSESYGMIRYNSLRPSLSANIAENQQVTNLHPDLHPLLVNLGVILHPLFGVPLIDDMLKVLKCYSLLDILYACQMNHTI